MKQIVNGIEVEMTQEEIAAVESQRQSAIAEMSIDAYKYSRATEYPAIGDQLDALFHAGVFPEDMAAKIQAVKDKYPKGGA
jgi:hypothetical protein